MSATLTKILVAVGALVAICAVALIIYNQEKIKSQQADLASKVAQQTLANGVERSSSQYATAADLAKFAAANDISLKTIQSNMKTLNDTLSSINVATSNSYAQVASNLSSTSVGPSNPAPPLNLTVPCVNGTATCPNQDPYGYQKAQQDFALNEDFGTVKPPIGVLSFSAFLAKPWTENIYARTYSSDSIIGTDENGKQTFYNKFNLLVNGKTYEIPIKNATTEQQLPAKHFSINPKLLLGINGGFNITNVKGEFGPDINVSIASYGQTKLSPDWLLGMAGIQYDAVSKNGAVIVTPFAYNAGKRLFAPLVTNTYIGPTLGIGFNGSVSVGGGLRVGF